MPQASEREVWLVKQAFATTPEPTEEGALTQPVKPVGQSPEAIPQKLPTVGEIQAPEQLQVKASMSAPPAALGGVATSLPTSPVPPAGVKPVPMAPNLTAPTPTPLAGVTPAAGTKQGNAMNTSPFKAAAEELRALLKTAENDSAPKKKEAPKADAPEAAVPSAGPGGIDWKHKPSEFFAPVGQHRQELAAAFGPEGESASTAGRVAAGGATGGLAGIGLAAILRRVMGSSGGGLRGSLVTAAGGLGGSILGGRMGGSSARAEQDQAALAHRGGDLAARLGSGISQTQTEAAGHLEDQGKELSKIKEMLSMFGGLAGGGKTASAVSQALTKAGGLGGAALGKQSAEMPTTKGDNEPGVERLESESGVAAEAGHHKEPDEERSENVSESSEGGGSIDTLNDASGHATGTSDRGGESTQKDASPLALILLKAADNDPEDANPEESAQPKPPAVNKAPSMSAEEAQAHADGRVTDALNPGQPAPESNVAPGPMGYVGGHTLRGVGKILNMLGATSLGPKLNEWAKDPMIANLTGLGTTAAGAYGGYKLLQLLRGGGGDAEDPDYYDDGKYAFTRADQENSLLKISAMLSGQGAAPIEKSMRGMGSDWRRYGDGNTRRQGVHSKNVTFFRDPR